jgi:hypothetical protein
MERRIEVPRARHRGSASDRRADGDGLSRSPEPRAARAPRARLRRGVAFRAIGQRAGVQPLDVRRDPRSVAFRLRAERCVLGRSPRCDSLQTFAWMERQSGADDREPSAVVHARALLRRPSRGVVGMDARQAPSRRELAARPAERSDADVHQRRDGPVQGRLRRQGARALPRARRARSASASAASTTTSRTSASPRGTTRSSRCSGTSASATTSRRRPSPSRGSSSPGSRSTVALMITVFGGAEGDRGRRRGARALEEGHRLRRRAHRRPRDEGQLLADGRDRPLRPLHRDPLVQRRRGRRRPYGAFGDEPTPDGSGWMEIWNLVFMQFERRSSRRASRRLTPCPSRASTPAWASSASRASSRA